MNCTALLLVLVLMGTAWGSPVPNSDAHGKCQNATKKQNVDHHFKHVSDLYNSSIALWRISVKTIRSTSSVLSIPYAECIKCTEPDLIIKPIIFQVSIYKNDSGTLQRCPYDLQVGCTCVKKQ